MTHTKKFSQECWAEYLRVFNRDNRRRKIAIEVADRDIGNHTLTHTIPLFAIDYDPAGNNDELVLTAGRNGVNYTHTIIAPVEIRESQDDKGSVTSLEVIDRHGDKTIIAFKS